jgi:hypothetical protein
MNFFFLKNVFLQFSLKDIEETRNITKNKNVSVFLSKVGERYDFST